MEVLINYLVFGMLIALFYVYVQKNNYVVITKNE